MNLRDGTFADVSALTGLDFDEDGRALALTDWDHDGDLDLWLRNRSGQQVRYLENAGTPGSHWVQIGLTGKTCNRDAIGAVVDVFAGEKRFRKALMAGEGNLAQSGKTLHFGLGEAATIDRAVIRWPDGRTQEVKDLQVDRRFRVTQGIASADAVPPRTLKELPPPPPPVKTKRDGDRIVLRAPLVLPPSLTESVFSPELPRSVGVVNLWAPWCAPCKTELTEFGREAKKLHDAGMRIAAVCVDGKERRQESEEFFKKVIESSEHPNVLTLVFPEDGLLDAFEAVIQHVRGIDSPWSLPTSLLIDADNRLQVIYLGSVGLSELADDAVTFCRGDVESDRRAVYPGRWATYVTRAPMLGELANELDRRGRREDANFYRNLFAIERRSGR